MEIKNVILRKDSEGNLLTEYDEVTTITNHVVKMVTDLQGEVDSESGQTNIKKQILDAASNNADLKDTLEVTIKPEVALSTDSLGQPQ